MLSLALDLEMDKAGLTYHSQNLQQNWKNGFKNYWQKWQELSQLTWQKMVSLFIYLAIGTISSKSFNQSLKKYIFDYLILQENYGH